MKEFTSIEWDPENTPYFIKERFGPDAEYVDTLPDRDYEENGTEMCREMKRAPVKIDGIVCEILAINTFAVGGPYGRRSIGLVVRRIE